MFYCCFFQFCGFSFVLVIEPLQNKCLQYDVLYDTN